MRLTSHITGRQQEVGAELPLEGQRILFRIRTDAPGVVAGRGRNRQELRPVDARIRMACRCIQRRKRNGEPLAVCEAVRRRDERIVE